MDEKLKECAVLLYDIGVVKFGNFTLKSGMKSPVYFDLRLIVSEPQLLNDISGLIWNASLRFNKKYQRICGVPYTALPIATVLAVNHNLPMVIRRKEIKRYGTKKVIEGSFREGDCCLLIEDVIVSGSSVYDTVQVLRDAKLQVTDVVVFLDREQGGKTYLENLGLNVHAVLTATDMMIILYDQNRIDEPCLNSVISFLEDNKAENLPAESEARQAHLCSGRTELSFEERSLMSCHPVAIRLFETMFSKKSNLCVAADVLTSKELLQLAEEVGPHICLLKTHIDILSEFESDTILKVEALAKQHNFLLFEDRKFADIGSTVLKQYAGGPYRIADWADIVTVHPLPGDGIVEGLKSCVDTRKRACVLVAEMSSRGALMSDGYKEGCLRMAETNKDFVMGFVSQSNLTEDPTAILCTPGVQLSQSSDKLGQQYCSPEEAILRRGADVIIVGRGVTQAEDRRAAAAHYQKEGFSAYLRRINGPA